MPTTNGAANPVDTEVLIVGGGPVGLIMSIELAYRGIKCRVIEQDSGLEDPFPKISLVSMRTMEIYRRWGLVDRIRNGGLPNDYELSVIFATAVGGWVLSKDFFPACENMETPPFTPERKHQCPQHMLMGILRRAVTERDLVTVNYKRKVVDFKEGDDRVTATVENLETGAKEQISARYMIACDGAASGIRDMLGISFEGLDKLSYSLSVLFTSKELLKKLKADEALRYILVDKTGAWANVQAVDGRDKWRLMLNGGQTRFDLDSFDPNAAVKRAIGVDGIDFDVISMLPWRRTQMLAGEYRKGRVFLAGDSAHTMSPTGGMGVNTGIGDAADLGFKLQGMLRGWGGEGLLHSYEAERRPVGKRTQEIATYNFRNWVNTGDTTHIVEDNAEGAETRQRVGDFMKKNLSDDWRSWGVQLGYRYTGSPIIIDDGTEAPADTIEDYVPTAKPGHRAPHVWLEPGKSVLDLYGPGYTLVCTDKAAMDDAAALDSAARANGVPFQVFQSDNAELRDLYQSKLVLVRPDGHVAWRADKVTSADTIIDTVTGRA